MVNEMMRFALGIVHESGKLIRESSYHTIKYKTGIADFVTDMDVKIENKICDALKERFPHHTFLCEEGVKQMSDNTWVLDPIDGTTNYVSKQRDFAISLAFYHKKEPVLGIVYDVMRDEMFSAIFGQGAFCNGKRLEQQMYKKLEEAVLDISMRSMMQLRKQGIDILPICNKIRGHRSLNCASLAICHIAQGINDIYISNNLKCWDYAAATIILHEVGGAYAIYQNFFTSEPTSAIFANNRTLITQLQQEYLPIEGMLKE